MILLAASATANSSIPLLPILTFGLLILFSIHFRDHGWAVPRISAALLKVIEKGSYKCFPLCKFTEAFFWLMELRETSPSKSEVILVWLSLHWLPTKLNATWLAQEKDYTMWLQGCNPDQAYILLLFLLQSLGKYPSLWCERWKAQPGVCYKQIYGLRYIYIYII